MVFSRRKKTQTQRTIEQLRHHHEVEKRIAQRLRRSSREERIQIMRTMYDELFAEVPDHPRLAARDDLQHDQISVARQMRLLKRYLQPGQTFLEFGPGNCSLAIALCSVVRHVYAVDINEEANPSVQKPENFHFIVYDGYNLDLDDNSIDIVFSNQMIEHLHPDDTVDHFRLVYRLLKPKGVYVFCTPHKFYGPCDISWYFSDVPEGFHLREWSFTELAGLVDDIGFSRWKGVWYARGLCLRLPRCLIIALEHLISRWPVKLRRRFGRCLLPSVAMIAQK